MLDRRGTNRKPRRPSVAHGEGRDALCRALTQVVAREGFDGVTFRSVAAEAGVTHGLASYHFGTRESMIHEGLTWAVANTIETTHLAALVDDIEDFAADVPHVLSERPEDAVFQFHVLLRAFRSPALLDDMRKSYDDYVDAVEQSLSGCDIEGKVIARLVFAALDGLTLQQLLYDDETRTEEALAMLRHLLLLLSRSTDRTATSRRDGSPTPDGDGSKASGRAT